MSTSRIGIKVPDDLYRGPEEGGVYHVFDEQTDMAYTLYECLDGVGALIGSYADAVGLVTWWRTDSLAEGMSWIDAQV